MVRPCFLVIDREHSGSISTRKLVLESAKFNVITAYTADEAVATLQRFPSVDGVVMDASSRDASCADMVRSLKAIAPKAPVVAVMSPRSERSCEGADYVLPSFEAKRLLELLQKLFPGQTAEIATQEERLEGEHI